jgi:hypothetical protein
MINKTKNQAEKDMQNYKSDEFQKYCDEAGWESWMEEYTEAKNGDEFSEAEGDTITTIQREMWKTAHNKRVEF